MEGSVKNGDEGFVPVSEADSSSAKGMVHAENSASNDSTNEDSNGVRRSKACENCRTLKVRCIPSDPSRPEDPCTRCLKRKKQCTFHFGPRKRSRKSDARVASLEKKIELLSAQLTSKKDSILSPENGGIRGSNGSLYYDDSHINKRTVSSSSAAGSIQSPMSAPGSETAFSKLHQSVHSTYHPSLNGTPESLGLDKDIEKDGDYLDTGIDVNSMREELALAWNKLTEKCATRMRLLDDRTKDPPRIPSIDNDVISRGIIKRENAEKRLDLYKNMIYQFHPIIHLPDVPFDVFRREVPILFLTIMATCSIADTDRENMEAHYILHNNAYETVVYQAMVAGSKTFELLQSILLLTFWCNEPDFYHHHKSHLLVNLAASVAADLGIGGMVVSTRHNTLKYDGIVFPEVLVDPKTDECRRMWLHVYCASMNMINVIRRPKFYLWTDYTQECCDVLLRVPNDRSYRRIVYFTRLTRVSEEIGRALYGAGNKVPPSPTDVRTKYLIAHFEERLQKWTDDFMAEETYDTAFQPYYCTIQMFLYQVVLYQEFSEKLGRSPFSDYSLAIFRGELKLEEVDCIVKLADATIACIKVFMDLDPQSLAIMPMFQYSRLVFCVSMILKMRLLAMANVHFRNASPLKETHFKMIFEVINKLNRVEEEYPFSNSCCCYNFVIKLLLCHFDRQARYQKELTNPPVMVVDPPSQANGRTAEGHQHCNGGCNNPSCGICGGVGAVNATVPINSSLSANLQATNGGPDGFHEPPSPLDMLSNVATRHGSIDGILTNVPYPQQDQGHKSQVQQPQAISQGSQGPPGPGSNSGFQYIGNDQDETLWLMGDDFWKELIPSVEAFTSYDI